MPAPAAGPSTTTPTKASHAQLSDLTIYFDERDGVTRDPAAPAGALSSPQLEHCESTTHPHEQNAPMEDVGVLELLGTITSQLARPSTGTPRGRAMTSARAYEIGAHSSDESLPPVAHSRGHASPPARGRPIKVMEMSETWRLLEQLTRHFDATEVLREAQAAGYHVPLLDEIDAAIDARQRKRQSHGEPPASKFVVRSDLPPSHSFFARPLTKQQESNAEVERRGEQKERPLKTNKSSQRAIHTDTAAQPHTKPSHKPNTKRKRDSTTAQSSSTAAPGTTESTATAANHASAVALKQVDGSSALSSASSKVASAAAPPPAAPSRPSFPFLELSDSVIRFRRADLPPNSYHTQPRLPRVRTTKWVGYDYVSEPELDPTVETTISLTVDQAKEEDQNAVSSFVDLATGLTLRQARFLHTGVNMTNILPPSVGGRRRDGSSGQLLKSVLPHDRVDWKKEFELRRSKGTHG